MSEIKLKNINKIYPNGVNAVKNINFEGNSGEFIVLVGPSGCGKSTLLRMIAGLEEISSGALYFADEIVNEIAPKDRNIGMVFQNYALYPHLTVFENIAFPLTILKESKEEIKKKVKEIAELLSLSEYLSRKPKELSGGQRQRVALGRAIIRNPRIFLFDEPLSNLDAKLRVQMRNEIVRIHRISKATSIYVTHDQVEAMTMGTTLVVLNDGQIQQIDTPSNVYNFPANLFVAGFIGSPQMNFFKGKVTISDKKFFIEENSNYLINLSNFPDNIISQLYNEQIITLGIRPEHLKIASHLSGNEDLILTKVENIENLGHEYLIYFKTSDALKCLRLTQEPELNINNDIAIKYDTEYVLFFNANGERIK